MIHQITLFNEELCLEERKIKTGGKGEKEN